MIDKHAFGYISSGTTRSTLSGRFTAPTTGLYTLHIEHTSTSAASSCIFSYIDNISLVPAQPNLGTDKVNIPQSNGATVQFTLDAGTANANQPYCLWMSASGTYPGIAMSGVTVPLNWDFLLSLSLYEQLPGTTGFFGTLDGSGSATAAMVLPQDTGNMYLGFKLSYAYVVASPGPSFPLQFASYPVHLKYIP